MTPRQTTAIQWPCARAGETVHPRFLERHKAGRWVFSSILTVNR